MKPFSKIIYGTLVVFFAAISWFFPLALGGAVSSPTVGTVFVAFFAALFLGELKQESIGQLYQALAASYLNSSEQVCFNEAALKKIRTIRQVFLASNIVKFTGVAAGLFLSGEKPPPLSTPDAMGTRLAAFCALVSVLIFARLWFEVSAAERILIDVKTRALLDARREAFAAESEKAAPHNFSHDAAAASFESAPHTLAWDG